MSGAPDWIRTGDVFVKPWGSREIVHVMLPEGNGTKKPYLLLHRGTTESTWSTTRSTYGGTLHRRFRYVGQIPRPWLDELIERGTLR